MAFQSNGPVMLALPPFRGFTRRIVLAAAAGFLVMWVLFLVWNSACVFLANLFMLQPWSLAHGMVWQLMTYPFIDMGLVSVLFALVTVWFFGSQLEEERGGRWLADYFFAVTAGGALLATLVSLVIGRWGDIRWSLGLGPHSSITAGMWPATLAMLVAFAYFHGEERIRFDFIVLIKAKHLVALYLAGYVVALVFFAAYRFSALVALTNALCGWMFLKWVPLRGLRFAVSEKWFGLRNEFYRNKRRRAAKEFEVYMRKQGKDVRVDDSNDKKWMN